MNQTCDICEENFSSDIKCISHNYCKKCIEVYYLNKEFDCNLCFIKLNDYNINDYTFPEEHEYKNLIIREKQPYEILLWDQIEDNYIKLMNKYVDDENIDELRKIIKNYNKVEYMISNVLEDIFKYACQTNNVTISRLCIKLGVDYNDIKEQAIENDNLELVSFLESLM